MGKYNIRINVPQTTDTRTDGVEDCPEKRQPSAPKVFLETRDWTDGTTLEALSWGEMLQSSLAMPWTNKIIFFTCLECNFYHLANSGSSAGGMPTRLDWRSYADWKFSYLGFSSLRSFAFLTSRFEWFSELISDFSSLIFRVIRPNSSDGYAISGGECALVERYVKWDIFLVP